MRFSVKGQKFKYKLDYITFLNSLHFELPYYKINSTGEIYQDGKWKNCRLRFNFKNGKSVIEVYAFQSKDGRSNIGQVDEWNFYKRFPFSFFNKTKVKIYRYFFLLKLKLLNLRDRILLIKSNLSYILLAVFGATIYFLINHFYDDYLQNLINNSNLVQSFIVFLSLSSIINIFHPFTFRKELSVDDVNSLVKKRSSEAIRNNEREKERRKRFNI